ncbi:MAG: hypothetical protein AMJ53_15770 [Gammaproteobacteria bacterium SG8_11]|nr:MAG: hypothetical protein AMJ53_15770 [Gammaproteobacteria bacterium SG8_11]
MLACTQTAKADLFTQDMTTICGWYQSLLNDEKYKSATAENKFVFAFEEKRQDEIKSAPIRMFYTALRTTEATQRYDLFKAYAEGIMGKSWECPAMQTIMREFVALDPLFQYSQNFTAGQIR